MPCIRCGDCADRLPRAAAAAAAALAGPFRRPDRARDQGLFDCIECGCCDLVCPSHIPLTQQFRMAKLAVRTSAVETQRALAARERHDARQQRLERERPNAPNATKPAAPAAPAPTRWPPRWSARAPKRSAPQDTDPSP